MGILLHRFDTGADLRGDGLFRRFPGQNLFYDHSSSPALDIRGVHGVIHGVLHGTDPYLHRHMPWGLLPLFVPSHPEAGAVPRKCLGAQPLGLAPLVRLMLVVMMLPLEWGSQLNVRALVFIARGMLGSQSLWAAHSFRQGGVQ